jgi:pyruvate/2-oxoglutarate dehydrogenase complex dihydrolipoamide dehydrogenase (E3) component
MANKITTDICVIGAGSGGLSVASGAVQMGTRVVLVEHGKMGGECLNTGCVPSKALIHAAHQHANDYQKAYDYVHKVIAKIAPHDAAERFEKLGVTVLRHTAKFINAEEIIVNGISVKAKYFVIATGSSPALPHLEGLSDTPFLTNETIFSLKTKPEHLIIIGGGPIGSELAQAYSALGSKVSLIQHSTILNKDDPELVEIIRKKFIADGIELYEQCELKSVKYNNDQFQITTKKQKIAGSHLLVAAGRKANIDALDLDKAGVAYSEKGITVDSRMRTNKKHIFAIGDAVGHFRFTHIANYQAGIVVRNALFRLPAKANYNTIPWVTFTNPELAHVGLPEEQAQKIYKNIKVLKAEFNDNDRALTENTTEGLIKVITTKHGKILGASIVGPDAGELIYLWILAIKQNLSIKSLATIIAPYPTLGEISKKVAGEFYKSALFSNRTKKLVRFLLKI